MNTTEDPQQLRLELMEIILQVDSGAIIVEQTNTSPSQMHRNHLREHCPTLYARYLTLGVLWEACLAAQAQYEMERQNLLSQGLSLTEAKEIAMQNHIFVKSEAETNEERTATAEMEQLEASYQGTDLTTILADLSRRSTPPRE